MNYILLRKKIKNIKIKIEDGKIFVYANKSIPESYINEIINKKTNWIKKNLSKQIITIEKYSEIINKKKVMLFGECFDYRDDFKSIYRNKCKEYCLNRIEYFKTILNIDLNKINFKEYKTCWGLCKKNNISINYKLVMVNKELIDYVLVHELIHIKIKNHSKSFYFEISKIIPNYKECIKQLKELSILTNISY